MKDPQEFEIHALYSVFLLFAICLSGSLTGANLNPSITLSNYLRKESKYTFKMIPIYFSGQFLGAILALIAAKYIHDVTFIPIVPDGAG
jgi:glycerol uptake facilitator-like aquaporin